VATGGDEWRIFTPRAMAVPWRSAQIDQNSAGNVSMDIVLSATEIANQRKPAAVAATVPVAQIAMLRMLWFWIPSALALWSAIVWTVLRLT
jgi:hypothetical protein